jgi:CheY-like chemotaxis protein
MMPDVSILLVEDDEVDVMAVKRALRDLKVANPLFHAKDGIEALEILRGENGRELIPRPYLILLDLNLPRMNGLEFLKELRQDPDLHRSIVFVMTTSAADEDRFRAYDQNVAGYVLKHNPGRTFLDPVMMLEHYWRVIVFPEQ